MHEYGIAHEIYTTARQAAEEHRAILVKSIRVEMGELVMANPEQVQFLFGVLSEEDPLFRHTELDLAQMKPHARCECGYEGGEVFCCPRCGRMPELIRGREIVVTRLEIEVEER